jgi:formylglycine-generating enzyme required for sulfatase activity
MVALLSLSIGVNAYGSDEAVKIFNPNPQKDDVVLPMPCDRVMVFKKVYTSNDPKKIKDKTYNAGSAQNKDPMGQNPNLRYVQGSLHDSKGYYFLMAKYELMAGQYDPLLHSDTCASLKLNKLSRLPAVKLSYFDAMNAAHNYSLFLQNSQGSFKSENNTVAYARLASDDEWEFAARGGLQSQGFTFAGSNDIGQVAWYEANSGMTPQPVATKAPNELGLYDMSGNIFEWCHNNFYRYDTPSNPTTGKTRRGGGWNSSPKNCRVSFRYDNEPDKRSQIIGMRLAI